MRIITSTSVALALTAAMLAGGCTNSQSSSMAPTPAAPSEGPTTMAGATHVLTQDEPYYTTDPGTAGQGMAPAGMLKAGTQVLVMVPGKTYCKVNSNQGTSCYTLTAGLKPISDK